jgi:hypothetical protein
MCALYTFLSLFFLLNLSGVEIQRVGAKFGE